MKKNAFTMIELIFVIVILGILAAVAIPKLSATRDDAKVSVAVRNLAICINDVARYYTATAQEFTQDNTNKSQSCQNMICFNISNLDGNVTADGNFTISNFDGGAFCSTAHTIAENRGLSSDSGVNHSYGAAKIAP